MFSGCSGEKPDISYDEDAGVHRAERKNDGNALGFDDEDQEMNAAIAEAKKTLPDFVSLLANPKSGQEMFGIKATFVADDDQKEHMWVALGIHKKDEFHGILMNKPMFIKGLSDGDEVMVKDDQVIDWFYHENGQMVGGFTRSVAEKRMKK